MDSFFSYLQRTSYSLKNDRRFIYFSQLKEHLQYSPEKLLEYQSRKIREIISYAYNHTSYYHRLFVDHGINVSQLQTSQDLKSIPPLTKQIIRKNLAMLKGNDMHGRNLMEVTSGGTTGEQGLVYHSPYYMQMLAAFAYRSNFILGFIPSTKWAAIRTVMQGGVIQSSLKVKYRNYLSRAIQLNALAMSDDHYDDWVYQIREFGPQYIQGYSSAILDFARYLNKNNINLPSIKMVQSTSEVLNDKNFINDAFNSPVADQYGSREIQAIGLRLPEARNMLVYNDNVSVLANPDGEILITALHSLGFPLINYKLGDTINLLEGTKYEKSDYPFQQISFDIGRFTDNFIDRKGVVVSSTSIMVHLTHFKLGVLEQQLIQVTPTSFEVNFIPDSELNPQYESIIDTCLKNYFGIDIIVVFHKVRHIPLEKSGKRRMYKRLF